LSIILSILPLSVSIFVLVMLQRDGKQAGIATLITTIIITLFFPPFYLNPERLLIAIGQGLSASLLIFYLLLPSLLLYHLLQAAGVMNVLALGITRLVPNRNLQVLLLVMGLAPFAESVSGFGAGTILIIPIFVSLNFGLGQSAILGILGQVAVPWGGLGLGTALGAELTSIDPGRLGAYTSLLIAPLPILYGLIALVVSGGKKSLQSHWPVCVVSGGVLTSSLYVFSFNPGIELAGLIAGTLAAFTIIIWGRTEAHQQQSTGSLHYIVVDQPNKIFDVSLNTKFAESEGASKQSLRWAMSPYIILTTVLLISRLIIPIRIWLQSHGVLSVPTINLHLALLYNPGFSLIITFLVSIKILNTKKTELQSVAVRAWRQFIPGALAIACFLTASQIMQVSKMTETIGTTTLMLGDSYKWFAPCLAALGGWITGSNAGSNALFSQLHLAVSNHSKLQLDWLMAAQNAASSHATMVAPTRTILAATSAGLQKGEVFLLKSMSPVVVIAVIITIILYNISC
jgi:lactate permease